MGEEGAELYEPLFDRASAEGRALVLYNIEWLASPARYSRIIIYDPYSDTAGDSRIIIYDPYVDVVQGGRPVIYDPWENWATAPSTTHQPRNKGLYEKFNELLVGKSERIPLIAATTSKPWALPPQIRRLFKRITIGLPDYEDRLEILRALDPEIPEDEAQLIASATGGHSFRTLKMIVERISGNYTAENIKRALREVESEAAILASTLYKAEQ